MPEPVDQTARERFRREIQRNFAVAASAGSGKTTAISERLAEIALHPDGAGILKRTAVVTYTKKAAAQIGQRARNVLLRRLGESGRGDLAPLDSLERAFFGTIHSFCVVLAQRYGQNLGINLNPSVLEPDQEERLWEEFIESDPMTFDSLESAQVDAFLRHVRLDTVFELARGMDTRAARHWRAANVEGLPRPSASVLQDILALSSPRSAASLQVNKDRACEWVRRFEEGRGFLAIPEPEGIAAGIKEHYGRLFGPMKQWLALAGAILAAELALRFRDWRFLRGVQNYSDQIDAAVTILEHPETLEKIRAEGWRVILDEAQDTDPKQFAVLVEITRPPGAVFDTWPSIGEGPRPGHFCMVGDLQQSIYGSRADIRNFQRHMKAFAEGNGGERLVFSVTFRTPEPVAAFLNRTLPESFGPGREYNLGVPAFEGAPPQKLQVDYEPLIAGGAAEGAIAAIDYVLTDGLTEQRAGQEARALARTLKAGGPERFGASSWGEVCVLSPRNAWLATAKRQFEAEGLKVSVQMRRSRNGDSPPYAWLCGLLSVICEPTDLFEWTGVLRELFCASDAELAGLLRAEKAIHWDEPERYTGRVAEAIETLSPFILRADGEGETLESFARDLVGACRLREKARAIDPSGDLEAEIEGLVVAATDLGLEGAGPRRWRRSLVEAIEATRASGHGSEEAITLATSHSSKGLEWPVVIPLGLWRALPPVRPSGFQILAEPGSGHRVFFDSASLPEDTKLSRERERLREMVRLLYVTLTRTQRVLLIPRAAAPLKAEKTSFQTLWGAVLTDLPSVESLALGAKRPEAAVQTPRPAPAGAASAPAPAFPRRLLPHQLSLKPDLIRSARHESGADEPFLARAAEDPIEYGLWWHETMEFLPWTAAAETVSAYIDARLGEARQRGFGVRGAAEWERFRAGAPYAILREPRWARLSELSVFSPLEPGAWIDGVIDLVLHDPKGREVWVVDWKTNRQRSSESDITFLQRLVDEYRPQLGAYGVCAAGLFPGHRVRVYLLATALGQWAEVNPPSEAS